MPLVLDGTNGVSGVDGTASNPAIEGTDSNTGIFYPAADTVAIGTGGTEALRVNSSQSLLLNTTSAPAASAKMKIATSARTGAFFDLTATGGENWIIDSTNTTGSTDVLGIYANGATGLYLQDNGNVGFGTSSPLGTLEISRNTASAASTAYPSLRLDNQNASGYTGIYLLQSAVLKAWFEVSNSLGALQIGVGGTERARINSAGYSKFSDNGTYLGSTNTFHEFRQSANDVTLIVHGSNTSQTDNVMYVRASRNTTNNTFYAFGYYNDAAGAYKMRVADSGTITNTTGTYTTISDIKLKQDIVDASSQWDDIKALRIVKYRLKEYVQNDPDSKPFLGLIAQEVEQVCPSLVEEQEDEVMDEDGKLVKNGEVTKGVKTSILYMKAVKALQEAMTRIEALEAEVQALKGNA